MPFSSSLTGEESIVDAPSLQYVASAVLICGPGHTLHSGRREGPYQTSRGLLGLLFVGIGTGISSTAFTTGLLCCELCRGGRWVCTRCSLNLRRR